MTTRPTLYILGAAATDDPLDCVGEAVPLLTSHYASMHHVGPAQDMSVRSMRRQHRPGKDRLLYDFTSPEGLDWALELLDQSPGAVLLSSRSPAAPVGVLADLRSAQRYAMNAFRFPALATVGALDDCADAKAAMVLRRPSVRIAARHASDEVAMAVAPGAIETAYAALRGVASDGEPLVILTTTRRDANDALDIAAALMASNVRVRRVRTRKDLAMAACAVRGLIDITGNGGAQSDAAFVANCIGAPVLRLSSPEGAGEAAATFLASGPKPDAAAARKFLGARTPEAFAEDLHTLIEVGHRRAWRANAVA